MKNTLILFHMTGCGHCIEFIEKWNNYSEKKPDLLKIESDNTIENENGLLKDELNQILKWKRMNVSGYPTIAKWNGKTIEEFKGERSPKDIIEWFKPKVGGKRKRNSKTLKKKLSKNKTVKRRFSRFFGF